MCQTKKKKKKEEEISKIVLEGGGFVGSLNKDREVVVDSQKSRTEEYVFFFSCRREILYFKLYFIFYFIVYY